MTEPTQVQIDALRASARAFSFASENLNNMATPAISGAGLPSTAIPAMDMGYGSAYNGAWVGMDLCCKLLCNILHTLDLALTRVANHYEGMDYKNAQAFGNKQIPPPELPPVETMPANNALSALITSPLLIGATLGFTGMIAVMLANFSAATVRYGGPVVIVPFGLFSICNLRDPIPHISAGLAWGNVQAVLAAASPEVQKMAHDTNATQAWGGAGGAAFNSYVTNKLAPLIDTARDLAFELKVGSFTAAIALTASIAIFVVATITAINVCIAANADPTEVIGLALVWTTITTWLVVVIEGLLEMVLTMAALGISASSIAMKNNELTGWLAGESDRIDSGSASLSVKDTDMIQDWQQWTVE